MGADRNPSLAAWLPRTAFADPHRLAQALRSIASVYGLPVDASADGVQAQVDGATQLLLGLLTDPAAANPNGWREQPAGLEEMTSGMLADATGGARDSRRLAGEAERLLEQTRAAGEGVTDA